MRPTASNLAELTADALAAEFTAHEIAAAQRHRGEWIRVSKSRPALRISPFSGAWERKD